MAQFTEAIKYLQFKEDAVIRNWNAIRGDDIQSQKIANIILDFSIHSDADKARRMAQKIARTKDDGDIGNNSIAALNRMTQHESYFISGFLINMLYWEKIHDNFNIQSIIDTASSLMTRPEWLAFVINFETAGTFSPSIQNSIGATGLIQFMPNTAIGLGTTIDQLKLMTFSQQMHFVYKHLRTYIGKYNTLVDLYCGIFWPAFVGKPMHAVITSDKVAGANPALDINKDLDIEKSEIQEALLLHLPSFVKKWFV